MPTIYEIAEHIISNKPYGKEPFQQIEIGSQGATTYKLLTKETTSEILEKVRNFVSGKLSLKMLAINQETAYQYLAAAKVIDLDTDPSQIVKSTYKIRKKALLSSVSENNEKIAMNMLNAFSTPPLAKKDSTIFLINEIDLDHTILKNAKPGEERDNHLKKIYTYCRKEAQIIPEMVSVIEEVIKERFQIMMKIAEFLPKETTVIYKGCSGAGKSFAVKKFTEENIQGIETEIAVQSTDNVKNDIRRRTKNIFSNQQVHLLGFSTFRELSEVMKSTYPKLSTLQEAWFNSSFAIESLFIDLKASGLKLEMYDFDGDYIALCLRILARYQDPNIAKPSIDWIERGFKTSRESRGQLLNSLREIDNYQFQFVHSDGVIDKKIDPRTIRSDSENISLEIENTKKVIIIDNHVSLFDNYLTQFIGMTIEAAFEKAKTL